jgi:hypothetical protein
LKVFFLDTNVFLQCRDLKDLPWQEIADGEDLLLLIPRTVQEEIDRQKGDGNTRRGKRARSASSFFREIIFADNTKIALSDANPRVEISFPDTQPSSTPASGFLDLSRPDDSIINELCLYQREHESLQVQLLTHDTNPMLTCKKVGVPFQVVPDEWLLQPEPDAKDKRISELERKIKNLETTIPQIEVRILKDGNDLSPASLNIMRYTAISEADVERLVSETCRRRPMKVNFDEPEQKPKASSALAESVLSMRHLGLSGFYKKPTDDEIKEYKTVLYPKWVDSLKSFYEKLPFCLGLPSCHYEIEIELSNVGSVPAEHVVLEIEATGGLVMTNQDGMEKLLDRGSTVLPPEPEPPKGKWIKHDFGLNSLGSAMRIQEQMFDSIRTAQKPDKNAFYRKNGNSGFYTKHWVYECDEFRHKVKPKVFNLILFAPPKQNLKKGAVIITVTAKNLPDPYRVTLPVTVDYTSAETVEHAEKLLPVIR